MNCFSLRKILFATDGSPNAEAALDVVLGLSWPAETAFAVLSVADKNGPIGHLDEQGAAAVATAASGKIQGARSGAVPAEVAHGRATRAIAAMVKEKLADLLVLGAHSRRSMVNELMLGKVADELASTVGTSVLLGRASASGCRLSRILLAVTDEAQWQALYSFVQAVRWPAGAQFLLFSVFAPPMSAYSPSPKRDLELFQETEHASREQLEEFLLGCLHEVTQALPENAATYKIVEDFFPAACILDTSRDWQSDLIILGLRRHQGLDERLLGSVSKEVVRGSRCHVVLSRAGAGGTRTSHA